MSGGGFAGEFQGSCRLWLGGRGLIRPGADIRRTKGLPGSGKMPCYQSGGFDRVRRRRAGWVAAAGASAAAWVPEPELAVFARFLVGGAGGTGQGVPLLPRRWKRRLPVRFAGMPSWGGFSGRCRGALGTLGCFGIGEGAPGLAGHTLSVKWQGLPILGRCGSGPRAPSVVGRAGRVRYRR